MPFFPGREVSTRTQKSSNENSTYSPHYCSCSPLHLEEIINSTVDGVPNEKNVQNGHNAALNGEYDEIRTRNVGNLANLRNDINEMKKENENNSSSNDDSNSDNNRTSSKDLNLENEQNVDSNSKHNLANLQNENNLVSKKQHSANNEDKNNNQNKSKKASKQAQLVCSLKPEPKVTSSTQDTTANGDGGGEEEVPYVIKFHNPPKQIFKAAVEVSRVNFSCFNELFLSICTGENSSSQCDSEGTHTSRNVLIISKKVELDERYVSEYQLSKSFSESKGVFATC